MNFFSECALWLHARSKKLVDCAKFLDSLKLRKHVRRRLWNDDSITDVLGVTLCCLPYANSHTRRGAL